MEIKDSLKGFICHGANFFRTIKSARGTQAIGNCPMCDSKNHFFVNTSNQLWDCKVCGKAGNFSGFLERIAKKNERDFKDRVVKELAVDRRLPKSAFLNWEIGWDGQWYTIPVRDFKGRVQDLRRFKLGRKMMATTGATLGLFGAHHFSVHNDWPVYVCEGEWDAIALVWLLRKLEIKASVVSVPGASIFKQEWIRFFGGRKVFLLYDKDNAGENGRQIAYGKIKMFASEVEWLEWPENLPDGFDVRDLIILEAIKNKRPRHAFRKLCGLLKPPNNPTPSNDLDKPSSAKSWDGKWVSAEHVYKEYSKWLHLKNDDALKIMFGTVFANKIQGEPIWIFLVAPPGGSKSELLMTLSRHPLTEATTSLTPHTLVSGAHLNSGEDPSLLPKLNKRILIIKDFTTILSMHYTSRDEIFGVLRDVYDGSTDKIFGTGVKRSYKSTFGILAGVTPKIEEFNIVHQSLGERFLKFRLNTGGKPVSESERIRRALRNINQESQMRDELCAVASKVLHLPIPSKLPIVPKHLFEKLINLAQVCAMLRGVVERDRFTQHVAYKPATEIGTRLAKQLTKLAMGISIYLGEPNVSEPTYRLIVKVALDTSPDRVEEIVRRLYLAGSSETPILTTAQVSAKTRLPVPTCFRILQDLELLRVVSRVGVGNRYEWKLGEKMLGLLRHSDAYDSASTSTQYSSPSKYKIKVQP